MLRLIPLLLPLTAAFAVAQTSSAVSARSTASADSLRLLQDSILARAELIVASDSTAVDELEKIAMIYKERKRFAMQLYVASRMASSNPASALAHLVHGDALLDNSQPENAARALRTAIALAPNYVRARVMLAETYEILELADSALNELDTALVHNPRHAQAHMQRARLLMRKGRASEAVVNFRAACDLLPDAPSSFGPWMKLVDALIATSAFDEAIDAIRYCMRLQPESPDPWLRLAEAHEKAGRTAEAIDAYYDFARRFPTDSRALDAERSALRLRYPPPPPPPAIETPGAADASR